MNTLNKNAPEAARELIGQLLLRRLPDGQTLRVRITETEAYFGEADTACHAHKGRTKRTEILYRPAGTIYVYLCYGIHWMLNLVTGPEDMPQAVLIRGVDDVFGPGRVTKRLAIDGSLNGKMLGDELILENDGFAPQAAASPRVGIGYAAPEDQARLWRFTAI
ncbi:MAG: DNA-3-methyladenine glycosylase [Oscillospiraceae bacterium]|nr:DNA-3-methyladenine glycosylase [Oscillospiraceae bacterium]MCD8116509.1 DNA-3-methyladenine glycosylase [Oscillospiraceae bacterium]